MLTPDISQILAAVLVTGFSLACSAPPVPPQPPQPLQPPAITEPPKPEPAPVSASIRELAAQDAWVAGYVLTQPAGALVFERHRNRFRGSSWTLDEAFVWHTEGTHEYLVRRDAAPFTEVTLRFGTDFGHKNKDYPVNVGFSESSRLLYTGYLRVHTVACQSAPCIQPSMDSLTPIEHAWRFDTDPQRGIIALDRRAQGQLERRDVNSQDTYIYFGAIEPEPASEMTLIIDPGMPGWMVAETRKQLPEFFHYFTEIMGVELDFSPVIVLSWDGAERRGTNASGGVLKGLVQLAATGRGWQNDTAQTRNRWLRLLAHESFHLWNGDMFSTRLGPWEEWLSEGTAEFFAEQVLLARGLVDQASFDAQIVAAANECAVKLRDRPVVVAEEGGAHSYYACGMAFSLV